MVVASVLRSYIRCRRWVNGVLLDAREPAPQEAPSGTALRRPAPGHASRPEGTADTERRLDALERELAALKAATAAIATPPRASRSGSVASSDDDEKENATASPACGGFTSPGPTVPATAAPQPQHHLVTPRTVPRPRAGNGNGGGTSCVALRRVLENSSCRTFKTPVGASAERTVRHPSEAPALGKPVSDLSNDEVATALLARFS